MDNTAMVMFNLPPQPGDHNLVDLVSDYLTMEFEDVVQANLFKQDATVASVYNLNPNSQRVIINKYFMELLFIFRSVADIKVIDVAQLLANDGYIEDWLTLMKEFILPFIVEHQVIATVNNFKNN